MLGIDIVDLSDPQFKSRDKRSLKLILNKGDQLIEHEQIFWLLWCAKEAVFKCHREDIDFSPTSIPIQINNELEFNSGNSSGRIEIRSEYILAVCSDNLDNIQYEVVKDRKRVNSKNLREIISKFILNNNLGESLGSDSLGLPIILPSEQEISISHHGRFGAFAFPCE